MSSKISSIGFVLLVLFIVFVSGCTSQDSLNDVNVTESDGYKHFEGKGISFNAPNTWGLGQMENWNLSDYLFSIGQGSGENLDVIHFNAGSYNGTLSDYISSAHTNNQRENRTIIFEKELTVDGLPAYQIKTVRHNKTIISTCFIKKGIIYAIYMVPSSNQNNTSIETDLEMVLNSFHTT